jgi:predicted nucleotidyltransferase
MGMGAPYDGAMGGTATQDGAGLPAQVDEELRRLVEAAREALGEDLQAIVLYGSAAEGRLRATSDVNLVFVLRRFERARVEALREPLRTARAAVGAAPMFLLASELSEATEAFAVKFADLLRRRRVLHGADPFAALVIPRDAQLRRLRQVLLNQLLRMRERFVVAGLREEQLARALADAAGPLRAAAATVLELEGRPAPSAKEALEQVARELGEPALAAALATMSRAREQGLLAPGEAAPAFLALLSIAGRLRERAARLA